MAHVGLRVGRTLGVRTGEHGAVVTADGSESEWPSQDLLVSRWGLHLAFSKLLTYISDGQNKTAL